jgi:small subunit ribosomal protein S7
MPRRASIPRKAKYQTVPANRTTARFTAKLMTNGKRNLSERILRQALARADASARRPGIEVLEAALRNATPIIEVKPRRVGGATYQVPVQIEGPRRQSLAMRWLLTAARGRPGKSMQEKLANELLDAFNNTGATIKRREDTHRMAEANRAFSHYGRF